MHMPCHQIVWFLLSPCVLQASNVWEKNACTLIFFVELLPKKKKKKKENARGVTLGATPWRQWPHCEEEQIKWKETPQVRWSLILHLLKVVSGWVLSSHPSSLLLVLVRWRGFDILVCNEICYPKQHQCKKKANYRSERCWE
jgi:hypothetical protein